MHITFVKFLAEWPYSCSLLTVLASGCRQVLISLLCGPRMKGCVLGGSPYPLILTSPLPSSGHLAKLQVSGGMEAFSTSVGWEGIPISWKII